MVKKLLSVLLVAMMMMAVATPTFADAGEQVVTNSDQFKDALADTGITKIILQNSMEVAGFDIGSGKELEIDLGTHTMTIHPGIGSAGTETNAIRVLKGGKLTVKNGTVTPSAEVYKNAALEDKYIKVVFANYGELTLEDVNITTTNNILYTINNRETLTLLGKTTVPTGGAPTGVAITNDPYTASTTASLNVPAGNDEVSIGKVLLERYNGGTIDIKVEAGTVESIANDGNASSDLNIAPVNPEVSFKGLDTNYKVGDVVEFSIETKTLYDSTVLVKGKGTLTGDDCVQLEYFDGTTYQPFVGSEFGPATGFPFMNAESKFRATFVKEGSSSYEIIIHDAADETKVYASTTKDIKVSKAGPVCAGEKDLNCDGVVTCDEGVGPGWDWNEEKGVCEFKGLPSTGEFIVVNTAVK